MNNLHKIQFINPERLTAEQLWLIYNQWYYGDNPASYSSLTWWTASDTRIVREWVKEGKILVSGLTVLNRM